MSTPLPPAPGVIKFVVSGTTPVFPWANIFHATYTGAIPSDLVMGSLCQHVYSEFLAAFQSYAPVPTTFDKCTGVDLSSDMGASNEFATINVGTSVNDKLPGNVCVLVSKGIARRYRGGRPRSYLYLGGDGDLFDTGNWKNTFTAGVTAGYASLSNFFATHAESGTSLTGEVCVSYVDKVLNPVPPFRRAVPLVQPVLEFIIHPEIASQRRRIGR